MDEEAFQLRLPEKLTPHEQLTRLWEIPEKVPDDFRIPEGTRLALASESDFKRKNVTTAWNELGGKGIILTLTEDEEGIKKELSDAHKVRTKAMRDGGTVDTFRTLDIAERKALLTDDEVLKRQGATHVMGLDVDVIPWGISTEPLGTPHSVAELMDNLRKMKGRSVMVSIGCAVRRVGSLDTASEQVHITLPLKDFDIHEYVRHHSKRGDVIGRVAGGIDFSDPDSLQYLGDGPVMVDRMWRHSPDFSPMTQLQRTIVANGERREALLSEMGDYFKGASKDMVKWVIYDALRNDQKTA